MRNLIGIIILIFIFSNCKNESKNINMQNATDNFCDSLIEIEPLLVLLDTTIKGVRYSIQSPNDTMNNTLFFFYNNNKIYQLDAERLNFHNGISNLDFNHSMAVNIYDSGIKDFKFQKLIVTPNYYLFKLSNDEGMFENICILFRDSVEVKKCYILPDHQSRLVDFTGYSEYMMWCSYFDIDNEIIVTEERIAYYNTGPYLVSVLKIERDTLIQLGESINNHEKFKNFIKKPDVFLWMLRENAREIITKNGYKP